ncbi:hypothetical protein [Aureliella helgolandensis]|uniref:hypothetical protein n=1 Tax=Aureliella helgolandensis TaxID=2527968 RepID=UPI00119F8D97|nr:hypothetical protein [Aureliella helgolandensis]
MLYPNNVQPVELCGPLSLPNDYRVRGCFAKTRSNAIQPQLDGASQASSTENSILDDSWDATPRRVCV